MRTNRAALTVTAVLALAVILVVANACQDNNTGEMRAAGNVTTLRALKVQDNASVGGDLTVSGALGANGVTVLTGPTAAATATPAVMVNNTGASNVSFQVQTRGTPWFEVYNSGAAKMYSALDIAGWPSYGAAHLRPIGNANNGQIIEFGQTNAITTTVITPVAISTVTAYGCQIKTPAVANAWYCGMAIGATNNITITTYEIDATPVATPAKGVTWWVGGN